MITKDQILKIVESKTDKNSDIIKIDKEDFDAKDYFDTERKFLSDEKEKIEAELKAFTDVTINGPEQALTYLADFINTFIRENKFTYRWIAYEQRINAAYAIRCENLEKELEKLQNVKDDKQDASN